MKQYTFLLVILPLLGVSFQASAQDARPKTITEAFAESYTLEYAKKYKDAIETLESVGEDNSYPLNLRLGWLYYVNGDLLKSQAYYKKAINLEAESVEALLGYVYPTSTLGNWDDVIKTYEKILILDPKNSNINYKMAVYYNQLKQFKKAKAYAEVVVKSYPFDYSGNMILGSILVSLGEINEAKTCYERCLLYNPKSIEAQNALQNL